MARYTCSVTVAVALADLYPNITEILKSCNLEVLIFREDYLMAREKPGQVPFTKLVTIEVLVDSTRSTMHAADFELVAKNEELPLKSTNHCNQVYQSFLQQSAANSGWRLLSCSDPNIPVNPPTEAKSDSASVTPKSSPSTQGPAVPKSITSQPPNSESPLAPDSPQPPPSPKVAKSPVSPPQPDPSRFTSLPKIAPRTPVASDAADTAEVEDAAQKPPKTDDIPLTWKPVDAPDHPLLEEEAPKLISHTSFEEFLAAGKLAESTIKEPPKNSSPTQPTIINQDSQSK